MTDEQPFIPVKGRSPMLSSPLSAKQVEYYDDKLFHRDLNGDPTGDRDKYNDRVLEEPTDEKVANLKSSLYSDGTHHPALDIDIDMVVTPSRTKGHWHLEFPGLALTWEQYEKLLRALAEAGILETGYVGASIRAKQSLLRLDPPPEPPPVFKAEPF